MKLYEIISNLQFVGIKNYQEQDIDSLSCNSSEKLRNGMYFCLSGTKNDGHNFAKESLANGATCLVVEKYLDLPCTQILVENARKAMSYVSSVFYETYKSKMKFIGITGTNGKTTTTFLIRQILSSMGKKVGMIGTEGIYINSLRLPNSMTTPDPINLYKTIKDMDNNGCEYCVMEVSAHAIALNKIDDIYYDVVAISNITKDHLDFFVNMENYIQCKASLFSEKHAKCGVVNADAKGNKTVLNQATIDIMTIGKNNADLQLIDLKQSVNGTEFMIEHDGRIYSSRTNLIGDYNISNVMMACAVLTKLDFRLTDILSRIEHKEFVVPGRCNVLKTDADFNVVVDFAHTPDGIQNILQTLNKIPHNNLITVFGCGGNRDRTKRSEMGELAVENSDYVIVTSDNPRNENPDMIIDEITSKISSKNMIKITDRRTAIEHALMIARQGDIVAILGKGAENYQEINGVKYHYSDYEVVDEFFKTKQEREMEL